MFPDRLKSLRKSKGFTQQQLAEKLGVKKQSVSNWENDNIVPSVEMLVKIADFFAVSTDYMLDREQINDSSIHTVDVTGLRPDLVELVQKLVDEMRK